MCVSCCRWWTYSITHFNAIEIVCDNLKDIEAIGADGTNINTGRHNGVLSLIEKKIQRKCHWKFVYKYYRYI